MRVFEANVKTIIFRFYLMMAVVLTAFFSGQFWLAIIALPLFLSALLGVSVHNKQKVRKPVTKVRHLPPAMEGHQWRTAI